MLCTTTVAAPGTQKPETPATSLASKSASQPNLGRRSAPLISAGGLQFKDLNKNSKLDPYEDWRLSAEARTKDLVKQMTLDEKVGAMMHGTAVSVGAPAGMGKDY